MQVELATYRASDRRVYNGAPCSDMRREWNRTDDLEARMKKADPTARCTYFPAEGEYLIFANVGDEDATVQLTGTMHDDKQLALIEAITVLEAQDD